MTMTLVIWIKSAALSVDDSYRCQVSLNSTTSEKLKRLESPLMLNLKISQLERFCFRLTLLLCHYHHHREVSNQSLLLMPVTVSFLAVCCFVTEWYIVQQKSLKKWIGHCLLGTEWYNFQPPTPTLRATMHNVTDRQTDNIMPRADRVACSVIG